MTNETEMKYNKRKKGIILNASNKITKHSHKNSAEIFHLLAQRSSFSFALLLICEPNVWFGINKNKQLRYTFVFLFLRFVELQCSICPISDVTHNPKIKLNQVKNIYSWISMQTRTRYDKSCNILSIKENKSKKIRRTNKIYYVGFLGSGMIRRESLQIRCGANAFIIVGLVFHRTWFFGWILLRLPFGMLIF